MLSRQERQVKLADYMSLTSTLTVWLRDAIKLMLSRNFPTSLIEIKALHSDLHRFRADDVPPRLESRNQAMRLFDEIQVMMRVDVRNEDNERECLSKYT